MLHIFGVYLEYRIGHFQYSLQTFHAAHLYLLYIVVCPEELGIPIGIS